MVTFLCVQGHFFFLLFKQFDQIHIILGIKDGLDGALY